MPYWLSAPGHSTNENFCGRCPTLSLNHFFHWRWHRQTSHGNRTTSFTRSTYAGNGKAQDELALRYSLGTGGAEKDKAKAVEWYRKASANGIVTAYFNLGVAYYNGDGVRISEDESCKWFVLAADAGMAQAQEAANRAQAGLSPQRFHDCQLLAANAYYLGKEIKQDYPRAMGWYLKLAEENDGRASERVAVMYDHGWGVTQDQSQSVVWLRRAADQGNSLARYELGRLYELGIRVPQDYANARKLYEAAANDLFTPAMVALSKMSSEGRGVKVNIQTAYMWAVLAANQKNVEGNKLAETLSKQLNEKQIADAKKEASQHFSGRLGFFTPKQ
jgi:TPR repeat protein